MRLTLGSVKAIVANPLNLKVTDSRVISYINRAQERLIYMGRWVGTTARYRVCVNSACITWPRQIETIEAWALCDYPGTIRNGWYEFLSSGPGIMSYDSSNSLNLIDRGNAVAFDDVVGSNKKLAIWTSVNETAGAKVILQYYDVNGDWVRTLSGTTYIDGEEITLPAAGNYAYSTRVCTPFGFTGIIKPVTNGPIKLYEYDTSTTVYKPLGYYEADETIPSYRRSLIPGLSCSTTTGTCDYCTVDVHAKLRHIPVAVDNDFLIIEHADAIRLACQAIRAEEAHEVVLAKTFWVQAVSCLDDQLRHWAGAGVTIPLRVENSATASMAIPQLQ